MLETPLLRDFPTHETLVDHPDLCPVALNVSECWGIRERSDFVADLDVSETLPTDFVHTLLSLDTTSNVKRKM
jgi:hypothetical protein